MTLEERVEALEKWKAEHMEQATTKFLQVKTRLDNHAEAISGLIVNLDKLRTAVTNIHDTLTRVHKVVRGLVLIERGHNIKCTICRTRSRKPGAPYQECKYKDLISKIQDEMEEVEDE